MTDRRCRYCASWEPDGGDKNPEATERELEARFGHEAAFGGDGRDPEQAPRLATNSKWTCDVAAPV